MPMLRVTTEFAASAEHPGEECGMVRRNSFAFAPNENSLRGRFPESKLPWQIWSLRNKLYFLEWRLG